MKKKINYFDGQFAGRLVEMLKSPAFRVLSLSALRALHCLEIEWALHGGTRNGRLIVTFAQFHEYGIHRDAIAPAIRELVALGFIEVTEQGRAGNADFRRPTQYRITYLPTADAGPTHEWRQITEDNAKMIAQGARREGSNSANCAPKNRKPVMETGPIPPPKTGPTFAPENRTDLGPETGPRTRPRKPDHYLEALHLRPLAVEPEGLPGAAEEEVRQARRRRIKTYLMSTSGMLALAKASSGKRH